MTPLALPPEETVQRAKWFLSDIQSGVVVELSRLGCMQGMASNLNSHHTEGCYLYSNEALCEPCKLGWRGVGGVFRTLSTQLGRGVQPGRTQGMLCAASGLTPLYQPAGLHY